MDLFGSIKKLAPPNMTMHTVAIKKATPCPLLGTQPTHPGQLPPDLNHRGQKLDLGRQIAAGAGGSVLALKRVRNNHHGFEARSDDDFLSLYPTSSTLSGSEIVSKWNELANISSKRTAL
ncbi:hypothetical protein PoB_000262400 [Plakobranchus ocellatus]|uniref:Uncharacterized protein n=1 Tax=Plakobranchus ocellatus TaxID=259542 RepID=A0AAV3Y2A0_9GAST|nr:hypothetical protein PoB_000262400 [Plakobranchus ocellatus]